MEVLTGKATSYPIVLDEFLPAICIALISTPTTTSRLTTAARSATATDARAQAGRSATVIIRGHTFMQNVRRGTPSWPSRRLSARG